MPAPPAGRLMFVPGAPVGRRRHTLTFGASLLALTAGMTAGGLAGGAHAQTVVGPGQTVTNNGSTTGGYALTGSGGTLINNGTVSTSGSVAVSAEVQPFSASDLTTYRILGVTLNNKGFIGAANANAVTGISINGFTW